MTTTRTHGEPVPTESASLAADQLAQFQELFPHVFAEGKVDWDKLRAALGDLADDRPERYTFTWAGKRDAIRLLQMPTRATLVPRPQESVEFDATQHLFIEGDNLEVLKLLYKSYAGRVKMIYIDPPYNTGNDFVYPDNYFDPLATYLQLTGQQDAEGNLLTSNPETSGRYHSAWLSMMYPRLFIARQLLREDGVIFVSIDDNEVHNLRLLMNEVFGEENFIATFVRRRRLATGMRNEPVSSDHEYIVAYARSAQDIKLFGSLLDEKDYSIRDSQGKYRSTDLTVGMTKEMRPNQFYEIHHPRTGKGYWPPEERVWRFEPSTMQWHIEQDNIIWPDEHPQKGMTRPRFKTRFDPQKSKPVSTWIDTKQNGLGGEEEPNILNAGMNLEGTKELRGLLNVQVIEYPKPVSLLKALIAMGMAADDLILDFFAGSCTTAQAVLELNREDGGNRRFIMVQLPEPLPPTSGRLSCQERGEGVRLTTIADIGKERIRRVIARMKQERAGQLDLQDRDTPEDLGVKVFKLAESHYRRWTGAAERDADELIKQMKLFIDPLLPGWKAVNIIYDVALKEGYSLNCRIKQMPEIAPNRVYRVSDDELGQALFICLDDQMDRRTRAMLGLSRQDILICRDVALTDELAANLALQCRLKTI